MASLPLVSSSLLVEDAIKLTAFILETTYKLYENFTGMFLFSKEDLTSKLSAETLLSRMYVMHGNTN